MLRIRLPNYLNKLFKQSSISPIEYPVNLFNSELQLFSPNLSLAAATTEAASFEGV